MHLCHLIVFPLKRLKFYILIISFSGFSAALQSQIVEGKEAALAFGYLYDFELVLADSIVQKELQSNPASAKWNLMSAYVAWSQILAGKLEDDYWNDRFNKDIRKAKEILKETKLETNEDLFAYIIVHAFKTRHELLNDNYLNAANDLNTCIDQISDSFGRENEYEPFHLTAGLYYYFMWLAYEDYFWIRPYLMLYPEGDKEKGLAYLTEMTKSSDAFLRNESLYFLMRIYYDLEKDYRLAKKYADILVSDNPNNLIYRLFQYRVALEIDEAHSTELRTEYLNQVNATKSLTGQEKDHFIRELDAAD